MWGCVAHVHIPEAKRGKLDDKSFPCIMLGVSNESKGYRLFDPKTKRIVVSKDVMFKEEKSWDWGSNYEEQINIKLVWGEDDFHTYKSEKEYKCADDSFEENVNSGSEHVDEGRNESEHSLECVIQGRERRKPTWMEEFVSGEGLSEEEVEAYLIQEVLGEDQTQFEEVVKHEKWRKAMDSEIQSIEKNQTWELMDLPTGAKTIGVKWLFKTKLNEEGEVDKYIARFVAKGYEWT